MNLQIGDVIQVLPKYAVRQLWKEHFGHFPSSGYIDYLCDKTGSIKKFDVHIENGYRIIKTNEGIEGGYYIYEWMVIPSFDNMKISPESFLDLFGG